MNVKLLLSLAFGISVIAQASAQDDLLKQLDTVKPKEKQVEIAGFKGLQICNMQSTKVASKGEWYILISHRFGDLTQGLDNFFGLDDAYTKLGAIYGATNWLSIGVSRQTNNKIYELTAKYKIKSQETDGFPVSIVGYNTMDINTNLSTDIYPDLEFYNRLGYSTQLLISRKFSTKFSAEIAPIYIHKNLYDASTENENQFAVGMGGRYKLTKRLSVNLEYAPRINAPENTVYHDLLSLGLDIETGGHIFQLVFSNCQTMNDVYVFSNATGKWNGGSIFFGFNLYRVF
ncbi:DUF5777 family beta-barrel protein [Flavobacterium gilvum]|uniref:DUF5777 domain-containing protein n=1 Tax=Flavobacterium gilvum TaxID=1492737 RepID=A0AAC9N7N4_9FLAO|nr:DUF5777 family beta-barrel protein [Flavobacterium gilvum]AOW10798.1 hypothetical protein EM308_15600 [Flavobacterium gilvum]KFC59952.1 hypothetical protein FEM08_12560 [Flavobacterium gilvum]